MSSEITTLQQAFRSACEHWSPGDTDVHLEELKQCIEDRLSSSQGFSRTPQSPEQRQDPDAAQQNLEELEQLFEVSAPNAEDVLELVLSDLLPLLCDSAAASRGAQLALRRLVSKMASTCSPRDTATLLLGQLSIE